MSSAKKIIQLLEELEKNWDDDFMLFSQAGTLCLVRWKTRRIIRIFNIPNDGGDPGIYHKGQSEYLDL